MKLVHIMLILFLYPFINSYSQVRYDTINESTGAFEVTEYIGQTKVCTKRYVNDSTMILNRIFSPQNSLDYEMFSYFNNGKISGHSILRNDMFEGERYDIYENGTYESRGYCHHDTCWDTSYTKTGIVTRILFTIEGRFIVEYNYCESGLNKSILYYDSINYKFIEYNCDTRKQTIIGTYNKGINTGKWYYYDNEGYLFLKEYYTKKIVDSGEYMSFPILKKTIDYNNKKISKTTYYNLNQDIIKTKSRIKK